MTPRCALTWMRLCSQCWLQGGLPALAPPRLESFIGALLLRGCLLFCIPFCEIILFTYVTYTSEKKSLLAEGYGSTYSRALPQRSCP